VSVHPGYRGARVALAAMLARAEAWLLKPAEVLSEPMAPPPPVQRPVVAVFGLAARCGATMVARALAADLAGRNGDGAAVVSATVHGGSIPLAAPAAGRLARAVGAMTGVRARALGRLCLVDGADDRTLADAARYLAPLVLDAGAASVGGAPCSLADHVVLVATPNVEPALARVVVESLGRVGPTPLVALNRSHADGWDGGAAVELPESRMGAQLALGGREPRGELGRAVAELADMCAEPR
jgi:hypothetical protein